MDTGNIIKWLDDLQGQIDRLTRKVGNGGGTPPTPTPANPLVLLTEGTTDAVTMILSQDGTSTWTQNGAKIKSGGGTFYSYVISSGAKINPSDYDTFEATFTFLGTSHSESVTLEQTSFIEGDTYDFGVYYNTSAQGNAVGMIFSPSHRPQDFTMIPLSTGATASGEVVISEITLSKSNLTNKRRKTK